MLLTSAFLKEKPAISLEEWVLVSKVFTTAMGKLRVKQWPSSVTDYYYKANDEAYSNGDNKS